MMQSRLHRWNASPQWRNLWKVVENDAPDVIMASVEPEQDPAPPLQLAEERPAPTGLELAR
ncbi:hypothetical protein PF003_g35511 [Phytophthora fragariae]|nr:hypothetical protein PF003_g35511 [Phytophthora fragariae]